LHDMDGLIWFNLGSKNNLHFNMEDIKVTDTIFGFVSKLVGHVHGGLVHVNVIASVVFASTLGWCFLSLGRDKSIRKPCGSYAIIK
jgi:hypothetical protein